MTEDELTTVLEIIGRSIRARRIADLAAWLITPTGDDGWTPAEHLEHGHYDRARMLAVTTTPAESARRRSYERRR